MEQKELRQWEALCMQEEPAACRAGCPLNVDVKTFIEKVGSGDLATARVTLEKSMPLAAIVARLCEAPCEQYCLRRELGGPLAVGLLEKHIIEETEPKTKILRLPAKKKKVALLGSGPSSLTAAFDLGKKGYPVTVYHLSPGPGGWLRGCSPSVLAGEVLEAELQRLATFGVKFKEVDALDESVLLADSYDVLYLGLDDSFSRKYLELSGSVDPETRLLETSGWFVGGDSGEDHSFRFITDVSQGREAAVSIDRFLQGASLTAERPALRHGKTELYTSLEDVESSLRLEPFDSAGFTPEEARQEAERCLQCECLECVKHCQYLKEYGAYPKTYARQIYNNSAIVKGNHQANTFINSCSLCNQCATVCPNDFSMADLCLEARQVMVREERMPPSAHWFALEEMRSARSEGAYVCHGPGTNSSSALFYPGCQLAGIRPEQTLHLYDYLQQLEPSTGVWLDCCGAPGYWAGREEEFGEICRELEEIWARMGNPTVIVACSSCLKMFREHMPKIPVQSVWSVLVKHPPVSSGTHRAMALSDPCTARDDAETRGAVRELLHSLSQPLLPLTASGEMTECCGFGGLMENANREVAGKVTRSRVNQTEGELLTYCAMCRDQLAKTGRPVSHVLDLVFTNNAHGPMESSPTLSRRRLNRRALKKQLLESSGQLPDTPDPEWHHLILQLDGGVSELLERRRILEDDIRQVLFKVKKERSSLIHGDGHRRIASAKLGQVTFWVQYREEDGVFHIDSSWSHRMTITKGAI